MTPSNELRRYAAGQIKIAIQRLASKYPFHAKVLERFMLGTRPDIKTMAVNVQGDNIWLWHDPEFVLTLPLPQLIGVLLHEVHHVLFGHVFIRPGDYPDQWALVVATEVTVNEFITEPLPAGVITLASFPTLPGGESTDRRYHRLTDFKKRMNVIPLAGVLSRDGDPTDAGIGADENEALMVVDEHAVWDELQNHDQARQVVQDLATDAAIDVGAANVPGCLRGAMRSLGIGTQPGGEQENLESRRGELQWTRLLRRYVGQATVTRPDFRRPSRRMPHLLGIVPGRRRLSGRPNVLAVIDTSASMTNELLRLVSGELARLAGNYSVTVVECDAAICRVYPFKPLKIVFGRGGTDLRPALTKRFLIRHRADLVIYFTDGFGPAPTNKPCVPVVWCLTPGGKPPTSWGRVVQIGAVRAAEKIVMSPRQVV